jgi:hypothetical protein
MQVHDLIFWTDTGNNQISVLSLKNVKHRRKLFDTDVLSPRAIAVDPKLGFVEMKNINKQTKQYTCRTIFWTSTGSAQARIESAGMDGSERRVIVQGGDHVVWPTGLTLDLLSQRIYWTDAKLKMKFSAKYDGSDLYAVIDRGTVLKHPFSISVFEVVVFHLECKQ